MARCDALQGVHTASGWHMLVRKSSRPHRTIRARQSNDFTDLCTLEASYGSLGVGDLRARVGAGRGRRRWLDNSIWDRMIGHPCPADDTTRGRPAPRPLAKQQTQEW